ncbi:UDP-N-acetylglucosamine 1-carboxyvinyltransferase 2 [Thermoclostridium stercorarium subsp. stercorarium DSM 8532]|uniref:UDP-N-acetylglucosamine 1-carboxyvinyltransferase n=3 Tax=Thermoclostridium stercorarium TaxID=1510 RepID=L7VS30_THES1|nr:UDP-N-acetylglucosamine 1-carboxyvinyltransferase [Thermoclostridium stercorarium]AGC69141.1 UDP-N-acetylglucosamine 1-carboxyvinyltransferase 2 [Thermoclostridium stercorarium subsp. stercorarium DSM 8532]AGI40110.1 UDP-N-acetylglucosamine 1-carboxyvinyltransferase [Thermoclostridium stercorarium subsp. stercorarium DSM 8532]ANW99425.1 UDP-N-acetylglucosamine 1-carboxyvinyltransferase [Thermoclostridium stercorarium subsp. thermolacticum DSM 2910]ANX02050.1 UDP-N-acetylglucosamine 1-carboxy
MDKFVVEGGNRLHGELKIPGAKNAVLPILAATVLNRGTSVIRNCPVLEDVKTMQEILSSLGLKVEHDGQSIIVDGKNLSSNTIPESLASKMRSSIVLMGSMLGRTGEIYISYPGGCAIGPRPIDLHLNSLRKMGAEIDDLYKGILHCRVKKFQGTEILLDYPSVGATENIMLAASLAEGETIIRNAAKEPEIVDLQNFLQALGVKIHGAGTGVIHINGCREIEKDVTYSVIPDRIVAGTYMACVAATGGELVLDGIDYEHVSSIAYLLRNCGVSVELLNDKTIRIKSDGNLKAIEVIRTSPYPGFPTDMQPQFVAILSKAKGTSVVIETVFENRYGYVEQLMRMGADITVRERVAVIKGVKRLTGAFLEASDLRGGAALTIAALAAEGTSVINNVKHIDRGYEAFEKNLGAIGAKIRRE